MFASFLILLISVIMFYSIILILKADKKITEISNQVTKFKEADFSQLKKVVAVFREINKHLNFGKIRQYFEISMTAISTFNLILILKKLWSEPGK